MLIDLGMKANNGNDWSTQSYPEDNSANFFLGAGGEKWMVNSQILAPCGFKQYIENEAFNF